ncbi:efflux RND transporter periplasmic adaptor subunit, partial [bacterium AH-315-C07]|nr:efflux RND transporter periplasmic adaptor subunit [bacterium AH-315-C07]
MSNKFKYIGLVIIVLIIFIAVGKRQGWIGQGNVLKVSIDSVKTRTIIEKVSANGRIQPEVEVKISPDVSGEIIDLYIQEGDSVNKGQLLLKIDPEAYLASVERSNASMNRSKADLASSKARFAQVEAQFIKSKSSFERNKKLYDQKVISDADYESAKAAFDVAKAEVDAAQQSVMAAEFNVKSAEAAVKEANDKLKKTNIFSPVNGMISQLNVEAGERVVQTSMMQGTEILRIANLRNMEVQVDVNENDIVRVNEGDTVIIEVDAYLGEKFKGLVTEVANSAKIEGQLSVEQVTNFVVKIGVLRGTYMHLVEDLKKKSSPFRPGMSANVEIQTNRASEVIAVPIQCVTIRDKDGEKKKTWVDEDDKKVQTEEDFVEVVFLLEDDKAILKQVKVGIQDDRYIEVKEGLTINDKVISYPYSAISRKLKNETRVEEV